jgi:hypothetical protein
LAVAAWIGYAGLAAAAARIGGADVWDQAGIEKAIEIASEIVVLRIERLSARLPPQAHKRPDMAVLGPTPAHDFGESHE